MRIFLVHVDGHGWYIKAASVRVAIERGIDSYARKYPRAMTVRRISEHLERRVDFTVCVQLVAQAEYDSAVAAKEVQP